MGITSSIARNLRQPEKGFYGFIVTKMLRQRNRNVELGAVELLDIQPYSKVLEVGFGPGLGLQAACQKIKGGSGHVTGIDYSEAMVEEAKHLLQEELNAGELTLTLGSVDAMPYEDSHFDRVFHSNCYYFWPDMGHACREIYRVMSPGGIMLTTLSVAKMKLAQEKGYLVNAEYEPEVYMDALKAAGFSNVRMEDEHDEETGETFQAIKAEVGDKN